MKFEKFKNIMAECHIDNPKYITEEYLKSSYDDFDLIHYPDDKPYLCLTTPPIDDVTNVMIFWVHPLVRRHGIGAKLLQQIPGPHNLVVDYRSVAMHKLLEKLGYQSKLSYTIDDLTVNLYGGDKLYYKE